MEIKTEIWKIQEHIQKIITTFEDEHKLMVEDIFLIRSNQPENTGKLTGVDMRVILPGSPFFVIKRVI